MYPVDAIKVCIVILNGRSTAVLTEGLDANADLESYAISGL